MADFTFKQYTHPAGTLLSTVLSSIPSGYFSSCFRTDRKYSITNNLPENNLRLRINVSGNFISDEQLAPGAVWEHVGTGQGESLYVYLGELAVECDENKPCPEGEKCVDGECQPCEEQQATHFQFRFEYEELTTTVDAKQVMYTLSDIYPIAGSNGRIIQGMEVGAVWYYPRIRFCNSNGAPRPYSGSLSFYGFCNPDGSSALYVNNFNVEKVSWQIGQKSRLDVVYANPWSVPRVLIEFIEQSEVIHEPECSNVKPEQPPDIEPVEPDEPIEPDEPEVPEVPDEPEEPLPPPTPPEPPEGSCTCEKYIGLQIQRAADVFYEGLILLNRQLSVVGREIVVELYEARKQNYQLSMFLQHQQFELMKAQHQRLYEMQKELVDIKTAVEKGLVKNDTGLIDCFVDNVGKTINSAVQDIEPVWIENEFNIKSHIAPQGDTSID